MTVLDIIIDFLKTNLSVTFNDVNECVIIFPFKVTMEKNFTEQRCLHYVHSSNPVLVFVVRSH